MDVRCPQCETLYEVDEHQLRGGGATLKCSQCDHVFRLQTSVALNQENRRRWMLRNTSSGDILYFAAFDQLHKWIMEGEASKGDEISRTGDRWTCLEDIGEFMPVFKAVDSISSLNNAPAVQRVNDVPDSAGSSPSSPGSLPPSSETSQKQERDRDSAPHERPQTGQRSRVRTSQQFPLDSATTNRRSAPTKEDSGPVPQPQNRGQQEQPSPQRSSRSASSQSPQPGSQGSNQQQSGPGPSQSGSNRSSAQSGGMRTPASDRARAREQSGGGSVDSKPLTGGSAPDQDWSFGDGSGLQEAPGHTSGSYQVAEPGSSSRWPFVALILVLLIGGGATAVYFAKPELVDELLDRGGETTVSIENEQSAENNVAPPDEGESPQEIVEAALDAASEASDEREASLLAEAVTPASDAVMSAQAEAKEEADEEAEEPDADEILAQARRLLERGNADRARKKYHAVLDLQRSNVEAITGLGWSLLAVGSPAAAAAQFRRAKSVNPSYGDAYIGLGKAERQLGNKQGALDAYSTYLSRFPSGSKASIAKYQKKRLEDQLGL